ncbi:MAG: diaminopimelate epimerase [Vulcanimicrobiaceae bacterium]
MAVTIQFAKMHGAGNDFVVVDARRAPVPAMTAFARWVCDRHMGVGADGLLLVESSELADVRMRILNADGSQAETCGNGLRCVARFLADSDGAQMLRVETLAGVVQTQVLQGGTEVRVRVSMGEPQIRQSRAVPGAVDVDMGNPHVVVFVRDLQERDIARLATDIAASSVYPDGANVHLAVVETRACIRALHHERGVGLTQACGSGAVAIGVAAIQRGAVDSPVDLCVPGGILTVEWEGSGVAYLTGPACRVFDSTLVWDA